MTPFEVKRKCSWHVQYYFHFVFHWCLGDIKKSIFYLACSYDSEITLENLRNIEVYSHLLVKELRCASRRKLNIVSLLLPKWKMPPVNKVVFHVKGNTGTVAFVRLSLCIAADTKLTYFNVNRESWERIYVKI